MGRQRKLVLLLNRGFVEPQTIIDQLEEYVEKSAIVNFIDGSGTFIGRFVIPSISETVTTLDVDGTKIAVELSIKLIEYYEDNQAGSEAKTAINNASALEENNPIRILREPTAATPLLQSLQSVSVGRANSNDSIALAGIAATNPIQAKSLMSRIKVKMQKGVDAYSQGLETVRKDAAKFEAVSSSFEDDLEETLILSTSLKNSAQDQDLTAVLGFSEALANQLVTLDSSQRILDIRAITRKKL